MKFEAHCARLLLTYVTQSCLVIAATNGGTGSELAAGEKSDPAQWLSRRQTKFSPRLQKSQRESRVSVITQELERFIRGKSFVCIFKIYISHNTSPANCLLQNIPVHVVYDTKYPVLTQQIQITVGNPDSSVQGFVSE